MNSSLKRRLKVIEVKLEPLKYKFPLDVIKRLESIGGGVDDDCYHLVAYTRRSKVTRTKEGVKMETYLKLNNGMTFPDVEKLYEFLNISGEYKDKFKLLNFVMHTGRHTSFENGVSAWIDSDENDSFIGEDGERYILSKDKGQWIGERTKQSYVLTK